MSKRCWIISVLALAAILCTIFIFSNSLKEPSDSIRDSDVFVRFIEKMVNKIDPNNDWDWSFIVRKSAHLFEFSSWAWFCYFSYVRRA